MPHPKLSGFIEHNLGSCDSWAAVIILLGLVHHLALEEYILCDLLIKLHALYGFNLYLKLHQHPST